MIGHLQRNKAKEAARIFAVIHSLDNEALAQELSRRAAQEGKTLSAFIEVNTSGEASKFGVSPEAVLPLVRRVASLPALTIEGFMTMGPLSPDPESARPCFILLRRLAEEVGRRTSDLPNVCLRHLSMGMSADFEIAIEEGATIVRLGTAIFGPRSN